MIANILIFFTNLRGEHSVFYHIKYDSNCRIFVGAHSQVEEVPLYPVCWDLSGMNFVKLFFPVLHLLRWLSCNFSLVCWYSDLHWLILQSWIKLFAPRINFIGNNVFEIFFVSVCRNFVKNACIYVHKRYWFVVVFSCHVFYLLLTSKNAYLKNMSWKVSLLTLLEEFVYFLFKHLIGFSEAIRGKVFFVDRFLNYKFIFLKKKVDVGQVIHLFDWALVVCICQVICSFLLNFKM